MGSETHKARSRLCFGPIAVKSKVSYIWLVAQAPGFNRTPNEQSKHPEAKEKPLQSVHSPGCRVALLQSACKVWIPKSRSPRFSVSRLAEKSGNRALLGGGKGPGKTVGGLGRDG